MDSPFIPLGSGQVLPWETHPSLTVLHQLKLFNFPVPNGIILINPKISNTGLSSSLLEELEEEVRQRELKSALTLMAFSNDPTLAVYNHSCTVSSVGSAIGEAIQFFEMDTRLDFLILEEIPGSARGRVFSQAGFIDDHLEFQLGVSADLMPVTTVSIGKLAAGETQLQGDFRGRVQQLLRSVRRALGEDNWALSWLDTGETIFITSIEKLLSSNGIHDIFLPIPRLEILPEKPTPLEGSLISGCSAKLFQYFHHWAPELWEGRPFVTWQENQIKFNVSLLIDFVRSFGLPTSSLQTLVPSHPISVTPLNKIRLWRNLPRLIRFLHHLTLSPGIAKKTAQKLSEFTTHPEKTFSELFHEWQTIIISSSHSLYRLTDLFLFSSYFSSFHFFAAKIEKKARESEEALRDSIKKALTNIHQAIRVKSLGWYSRGLLPSDESIWQLTAEQILAIESQLE